MLAQAPYPNMKPGMRNFLKSYFNSQEFNRTSAKAPKPKKKCPMSAALKLEDRETMSAALKPEDRETMSAALKPEDRETMSAALKPEDRKP